MPGKLTLHPPQRAPRFLVLQEGETLEIGRDPTCRLVLEDARVSKRHARLRWTGGGWVIEDLGSKNGTTVNGEPASDTELRDGDWISLGGLVGRFERLTAAQAATLDSDRVARIHTSADLRRRLGTELDPLDLLIRFLEFAQDVTGTERGFVVLCGPDGQLRVEAAAGFTPAEVQDDRFRGSVGAVKQALQTGGPVIISNAQSDPRLGKRPSVIRQGISSLACIPLRHSGRMLGVIYVDSRKLGPAFTAVDIETLEALADRAAAVLAQSVRSTREVSRSQANGLVWHLQQRLEELLPAI